MQKFALKLAVPLSGLSYRVIHIKVSLKQINLLGLVLEYIPFSVMKALTILSIAS